VAPKSSRRGKLRRVKKKKQVRREGSALRRDPLPKGVRMLLVAFVVVAAIGMAFWVYFAMTSVRESGPVPPDTERSSHPPPSASGPSLCSWPAEDALRAACERRSGLGRLG
jgi:hypothetical protein